MTVFSAWFWSLPPLSQGLLFFGTFCGVSAAVLALVAWSQRGDSGYG